MTQISLNTPELNTCDTCGRSHITASNHVACAGHRPCHRRRPQNGSRYCVVCATTQSGNETLGPVTGFPVTNPLERLASLAGRVEGWLNVAESRLSRLTSFGDGEARLTGEMKAWTVIVRQLGFLLGLLARLDLDERLAKLDRIQAEQLREVLEAAMRDPALALTAEQAREWPRAFARAARRRVAGMPPAAIVDGEVNP